MTKKTRKTHKMRKVLLTVCCAALLVCVTIGATVAYLTSTDTVTNTFTVGNVTITLDEAKVGTDGKPVDPAQRVDANSYKLLPGHTYNKDPMVTVKAGSEECYVRVFVTINEQADLDAIFAPKGGVKLDEVLTGRDASKWVYVGSTVADNAQTYELRYFETVTPTADADTALEPVFTKVEIPDYLTNDDLAKLNDLKITVVAQAIQADGFKTADLAWAEFPTT